MKQRVCLALILLIVLMITGGGLLAQGNLLTYGTAVVGSIQPTNPLAFYTFNGTEGDLVSIRVIALSPGLLPVVSLNSPTQQQLDFNDNDPFNPNTGSARIDYRLPSTGIYSILVGGGATSGDFVLRLDARAAPAQIIGDEPQDALFPPGSPAQSFNVAANPDQPLALTISAQLPGFTFLVMIRNLSGQIIATLSSGSSGSITYVIPAGDATYEVEIIPTNPAVEGFVTIRLGLLGAPEPPAPDEEGPAPVATEEAAPPEATAEIVPPVATEEVSPDEAACAASSSSAINIRSGPSTSFGVIAVLQPGQQLAVVGYNGDWYALDVPRVGLGWVRNDLVTTSGACDDLPLVQAEQQIIPGQPTATSTSTMPGPTVTASSTPPPPTATNTPPGPTATSTNTPPPPTATNTPPGPTATSTNTPPLPTATYTPPPPTATYTSPPPTATYTPSPSAPIAPPDANFNSPLNVPLDSTASTTDFVSYPDGDREDRVRYSVTGLSQTGRGRLIITASCFGTGTQHIQFFTGGQTYSCGQTIVDRNITFDSNTGTITITAVGGTGTYVQWVLTGSATRTN